MPQSEKINTFARIKVENYSIMDGKTIILLLFSAILSNMQIMADEYTYPYLTLETQGGAAQSIAVASLTLTISDGKLVLTNAAGTETFPLENLSRMYFSASAISGIEETETEDVGEVEIFSPTGISQGRFDTLAQARAKLRSGIYVVNSQKRNFKIIVR